MSDLITLSRKHQSFYKYLDGSFSNHLRAIAVETLNVNTASETVTFKIVPLSELAIPNWWRCWLKAIRVESLLYLLLPILLTMFYFFQFAVPWDPLLAIFCIHGVVWLRIAGHLLNDYFDHLKGIDRIDNTSGSRVIQRGWLPAFRLYQVGIIALIVGLASGIPALIFQPSLVWLLGVAVFIGVFQFSSRHLGLKYNGMGELTIFLLTGPLLVLGFSWAVAAHFSFGLLLLGILVGWFEVLIFNLKNFSHIMVTSQAGFRNWIVLLGFDKSKKLIEMWLFAYWVILFLYSYVQKNWFYILLMGTVFLFLSFPLMKKIKRQMSCLGTQGENFIKEARVIQLVVVVCWLCIDIFILYQRN